MLDGKFHNNETNYTDISKCTIISTNSTLFSTNGWNYHAEESYINATNTEHEVKGGQDNVETKKCELALISSIFKGPVPHTLNTKEDIVRLISSEIKNDTGMGRLAEKCTYEENKNTIEVEQDVSNFKECKVTDTGSSHKSKSANAYTAENCKMITKELTLDPKVTSMKLTDCNAVDNKSSLKGTKEMDLSGTTMKIDGATFDGDKKVSAGSSTVQASASTEVVNGDFDNVIYDLQKATVKKITITNKSMGRLFQVTCEEVTMDDSHGEFENCNFQKVTLNNSSLLTHNTTVETMTLSKSTYDFRKGSIKDFTISSKSQGKLSRVTLETVTSDDSSGEYEGSTVNTATLTNSSLSTHNSDIQTASIDKTHYELKASSIKELTISNQSTGKIFGTTSEAISIAQSVGEFSGCTSSSVSVDSSSLVIAGGNVGDVSISNSSVKMCQATGNLTVDDNSRVEASGCSGSLSGSVDSKSLSGDMTCIMSGNLVNLTNKGIEEHSKEDVKIKSDAQYKVEGTEIHFNKG